MTCIFLISDPHYGHENICKFLRHDGTKLRPFENAQEMDEIMVQNHNSVVKPGDKVYFLGDIAMKEKDLKILDRLNGQKRLIRGNHDIFKTKEYSKYFKEIYGVRVLSDMILSHYPIHPDSITKRYNCNVHGHIHYHDILDGKYLNVCVEHINYTPVSLEEVREMIKKKQEMYPPVYQNFKMVD